MKIKTRHTGTRHLDELDPSDRATIRRWYKVLRIAVYAPQSYTGASRPSYQGCYGMERQEAKEALVDIASAVDWAHYLGSK